MCYLKEERKLFVEDPERKEAKSVYIEHHLPYWVVRTY